jgi:hypothetical protein
MGENNMKTRSTIILAAAAVALSFAFTAIVTPKAVKAAIATLIRDQDNAARRPFNTFCQNFEISTSNTRCFTPNFPAGEEVVIETVSVNAEADPMNTQLVFSFTTVVSGVTSLYPLSPMADGGIFQPSRSTFGITQSARVYADPGTSIGCAVATNGSNTKNPIGVQCFFSGYTVSLP